MELYIALVTYLIILVIVLFLLLYVRYTVFAAVLLALIIAYIYINIAFPVTRDELDDVNASTVIYTFIQLFTIVVVLLYAIINSLGKKRVKSKFPLKLK